MVTDSYEEIIWKQIEKAVAERNGKRLIYLAYDLRTLLKLENISDKIDREGETAIQ